MKNRTRLCGLLMCALLAGAASAEDFQTSSLRGLSPVVVVVEEPSPACSLDKPTLQTDVEVKLRVARIPLEASSSSHAFYVRLNCVRINGGGAAYSIELQVMTMVTITATGATVGGVVWNREVVGVERPLDAMAISSIRQRIQDQVDVFVNAYLTANPGLK